MRYSFFRLLLLLLYFTNPLQAQPYYFRHYQVENGLSNNTVFCSTQDKAGFMWFGTKDGLNRFDGYRFKLFNVNSDDETNLSRDGIFALATDHQGILWVGSQKGLYRFDEQKERLVPFIDSLHEIYDLLADKTGQLWFISGYTLCRYNFEKKKLTVFPPDKYFRATSLCQLDDGRMCISTEDGFLKIFDIATSTLKSFDVFAHSPPAASRNIVKILPGKKGAIYIGTISQGLKQFDVTLLDYTDMLITNPDKTTVYVRDILCSGENEFWVATESGIFILNTDTGKFTNLKKKYLDPYSLSDNAIYTLYKDKEGGVWAGTYFGGLNYFPKQNFTFQKYFPDFSKNSISGSAVREICEDDFGNLWIGTEDAGLNKLNPRNGQLTRFEPTGSSTTIAYSNIHGLLADKNKLWIGTFEHGLDVMDITTGKVVKHYVAGLGPHELKSNFIVTLLKTKSGDIYTGGSNGFHKYLPGKDGFLQIHEVPQDVFISSLTEDYYGNIWVGTHERGIFYFNPATGAKGHFENVPDNKNSLTTNTINAIYEDSFYNLWIATEGGGLCRLNQHDKRFTRFTTKTGMPSNFVFKVVEDNNKNIWATTSKGLVKFTTNQQIAKIYTKANGLLNDQFNYNSGYKDEKGKIYFGSVRGMITFQPDEFLQSHFTPPVYITGFQVHNQELSVDKDSALLKKSIVLTDKITLTHNQSSFSIDFAAISYTSPEVTEYSYLLEGLDKEWTYIKSNRKVYFTNLKPGNYTFKIKAASDGNWGKEQKKLRIQILPPFWATWWAYSLYFILTFSLLFYFVRSYHNVQTNKKEKAIYNAKFEFFTNIAHEIKTPLTLIKGPVENLNEMVNELPVIKEDVATMERSTARLVNLVNQILDFRQVETKGFSLDFTNCNITRLLQEAYATFEPVAKKRDLHYTIDNPLRDIYTMADEEALNKIFSNLFSNAVKYADKQVYIKLTAPTKSSDYLCIQISNDGFTIPNEMREKIFEPFYRLKETAKQKGTGIGLALARSLTELHKGSLFMKDSEGENIFMLQLPYNPQQSKINTITKIGAKL